MITEYYRVILYLSNIKSFMESVVYQSIHSKYCFLYSSLFILLLMVMNPTLCYTGSTITLSMVGSVDPLFHAGGDTAVTLEEM